MSDDMKTYYAAGCIRVDLQAFVDSAFSYTEAITRLHHGCVGAVLLFETEEDAEAYAAKHDGAMVIEVKMKEDVT